MRTPKFQMRHPPTTVMDSKLAWITLLAALLLVSQMASIATAHASTHLANSSNMGDFINSSTANAGYTHKWLMQTAAAADKAYAEEEFPLAGRLWQNMAVLGDREAAFRLGMLHELGRGVEHNAQHAVYWYQRAAQAGHIHAQHNLAVAYANGEGVGLDIHEALKWWQIAARQGNSDSQYNLGIIYATGSRGVERDVELARHWWHRAALGGDAQAQYNLGALYASADGRLRNYCEAIRWWEESARNGIQQARRALHIIKARQDNLACW